MPLLPVPIFQPDQDPNVTVPDDFTPPSPDQEPMLMDEIQLDGRPLNQRDPFVGPPAPPPVPAPEARAKMYLHPDMFLDGRPLDQRNAFVGPPAPPPSTGPTAPGSNAPPDPMKDPSMLAFMADRAQHRSDLATAQKKGDDAAKWADISNGFRRASDLFAGRTPASADQEQTRINAARNAPVQEVLQQQQMDQDSLKQAEGMQDLTSKVTQSAQARAELDPNSQQSQRAKLLATAQGLLPTSFQGDFSASMYGEMLKGASIQEAVLHHKTELTQLQATLSETRNRHVEQMTHDRNQEQIERDRLALEAKRYGMEGAKGKPLPAGQEQRIQAAINGIRANRSLQQAQNATGLLSPMATIGYGEENAALAPEIAAANSSTGAARPEMVKQAEASAPSRFTPNAVANKYFNAKQHEFDSRASTGIDSFKRGGYDVAGLEQDLANARAEVGQAPSGAPAAHPQDSQAIDWAKSNPNDPRSAAILKANGVQ